MKYSEQDHVFANFTAFHQIWQAKRTWTSIPLAETKATHDLVGILVTT